MMVLRPVEIILQKNLIFEPFFKSFVPAALSPGATVLI
jgi:hypothetical protein